MVNNIIIFFMIMMMMMKQFLYHSFCCGRQQQIKLNICGYCSIAKEAIFQQKSLACAVDLLMKSFSAFMKGDDGR